jgi:hypothetical protein
MRSSAQSEKKAANKKKLLWLAQPTARQKTWDEKNV